MWESYQEGTLYWIVYTSDGITGRLYHYNKSLNTFTLIYDVLTATIYSNAITVSQGFYDYLFFTNGIDAPPLAIRMAETVPEDIVTVVSAIDYEGRDIRGLALESYDNRVVMTSAIAFTGQDKAIFSIGQLSNLLKLMLHTKSSTGK